MYVTVLYFSVKLFTFSPTLSGWNSPKKYKQFLSITYSLRALLHSFLEEGVNDGMECFLFEAMMDFMEAVFKNFYFLFLTKEIRD